MGHKHWTRAEKMQIEVCLFFVKTMEILERKVTIETQNVYLLT